MAENSNVVRFWELLVSLAALGLPLMGALIAYIKKVTTLEANVKALEKVVENQQQRIDKDFDKLDSKIDSVVTKIDELKNLILQKKV